ncbi:hypothetical protein, partial [Streptococcus agalactiae]|uniref:hypothetical protein n=1 Tax=Streptococcus agalactiae TaxID=1311 RepID=UPI00074A1D92
NKDQAAIAVGPIDDIFDLILSMVAYDTSRVFANSTKAVFNKPKADLIPLVSGLKSIYTILEILANAAPRFGIIEFTVEN